MLRKIAGAALVCALFTVLAVRAGASGNNQKGPADSSVRPKIVILTSINVDTEGTDVNDNDYINYIRDTINVDIEFINDGTTNYRQKMNTMLAGNQPLDAFMLMDVYQRIDLARWAGEGALMPLDDVLPKYGKDLLANIKDAAWKITKHDGKIYAVPFQRYDSTPYMTFVRKDWLERLRIDPEKDLVTIDDWYNMLKRFVTDDPDGNGRNDTAGIISTTSGTHFTNFTFLDSFGAARAKYVNGELLPNYMLPEYKEWLKFMNKLYNEKILDQEFIVASGSAMWDKLAEGKYGAFLWFWGLQEYLSKGLDRANLVAVSPPVRADGSKASYVYSSPNRHMMAITADCKNVEAVMKFFNWSCTEEGGVFLYAGLEGKDYTRVNGKIELKPDRRGKNLGWRQLTLGVQQPNVDKEPYRSILAQSFGDLGMQHLAKATSCGAYNELELYCPVFEELSQYDFNKPVAEFTDKAITGAINIDAEWDGYIRNLRRMGGDRKIQLSTEWYNGEYKK
jgi:putative aldouronate transport system substrate-binding protein